MKKILLAICLTLVLALSACATGPAVPLTQDEQTRVSVTTVESSYMAIFRSARQYVVDHPQYKDKWNTAIQPMFFAAKVKLDAYDQNALNTATPPQIISIVETETADAITAMIQLGWIKPVQQGVK